MKLSDLFAQGKFVVTGELGPPKGCHLDHLMHEAEVLRGRVAGINVTDLQAAAMRLGSLVTCKRLLEHGLPPVLQITCRDRNRISLQSELLGAAEFGIENILCLTGDHNILGDHADSMPVFDLDAVSLLQAATTLMGGKDMAGNDLEGDPPDLCLGCVVNPGADPVEPQIIKLKVKQEAGARFCQTQAVYEVDVFKRFRDAANKAGITMPIMAGLVMLKSAGMAKYMNRMVAGVFVPPPLIQRMTEAADKPKTSIEITVELIQGLRPYCDGVHIMSLGWDQYVPAVLDGAAL
jgi:methylenetetrahydrofolate reductase (NADPH)